jgi:3',5'-nucleoside bisphosphate phosphatase
MHEFRADLHIHTVLSPCGDLEMSPSGIVEEAKKKQLDIIGITDHNSTLHCKLVQEIAAREGILVLMGAEVTTKEEIHCLTFFENTEKLHAFQEFLDENLPAIPNDPYRFGYQVVVNEKEEIIQEVPYLLISALDQSMGQLEQKVHELDGFLFPAHINKKRNSLISQLGFIPNGLLVDGFEVLPNGSLPDPGPFLAAYPDAILMNNSDAHTLNQLGSRYNLIHMQDLSFGSFREALKSKVNFKVITR